MAEFESLVAVAAPIALDNIDTDQIFPSRFISKDRRSGMYGNYFLHDLRFDDNGKTKADFVLNEPAVAGAKIIVAAANYACGSARPGAIQSHLDYGIQAIIAESYGPLFPTVAFKAGLLTIQLAKDSCRRVRQQLLDNPGAKVTIDLSKQIVVAPDRTEFSFEIDSFVKRIFIEGINEVDLTLESLEQIEAFETRHRASMPWVYNTKEQSS